MIKYQYTLFFFDKPETAFLTLEKPLPENIDRGESGQPEIEINGRRAAIVGVQGINVTPLEDCPHCFKKPIDK